MNIKANISIVDYRKYKHESITLENSTVYYDENTTFNDIRKRYKIPNNYVVTHIDNYDIDYRTIICEDKFPYIIEETSINWNCDINTTKVQSLIRTLNIFNDTLVIRYSTSGVGDPYFSWKTIWDWINNDQNAFNNICTIISLTSTILIPIINFFKNFRKNNKIETSNFAYVDFILRRNMWTSKELAKFYKIDKKTAINLLKFLGYEWNRKKLAYIITDAKRKSIRNKIKKQDETIETIIYNQNINEIQDFINKREKIYEKDNNKWNYYKYERKFRNKKHRKIK